MTTCNLCGSRPPGDAGDAADAAEAGAESGDAGESAALPMTWVTSVENGERNVTCPACAREHLRSIEAKLDSPWW